MKKLTISIDFDGVLNMAEYPGYGRISRNKIIIIRKWLERGHTIIFNSCRSHEFLRKNLRKEFDALYEKRILFNRNSFKNIEKYGGDCRKIYADVYIDDHNILQIGKPIDFEEYDKIIRRLEDDNYKNYRVFTKEELNILHIKKNRQHIKNIETGTVVDMNFFNDCTDIELIDGGE